MTSPATSPSQEAEGSGESWQCLNNRLLVPIVDRVLLHVTRLVSIFSHVIDNHQPGPAKSQVRWREENEFSSFYQDGLFSFIRNLSILHSPTDVIHYDVNWH